MNRPRRRGPLWLCWTIGHSIDPMETDYVGCSCWRCGRTFWEDRPREDLWFWLGYYNTRGRLFQFFRRFGRGLSCPDCGNRGCDKCAPF